MSSYPQQDAQLIEEGILTQKQITTIEALAQRDDLRAIDIDTLHRAICHLICRRILSEEEQQHILNYWSRRHAPLEEEAIAHDAFCRQKNIGVDAEILLQEESPGGVSLSESDAQALQTIGGLTRLQIQALRRLIIDARGEWGEGAIFEKSARDRAFDKEWGGKPKFL